MRTNTGVLLVSIALLTGPPRAQAQVRPDIYSFTGGVGGQRELLYSLMEQYIDGPVIAMHCNMASMMTTGGMIHSDWDFLPFHRTYLEGLEDFLIAQGHPDFVPLPYWSPMTDTPYEFKYGGAEGIGVDPDCDVSGCPSENASVCLNEHFWNPQHPLPSHLALPDLCNLNMLPTFPDPGQNGDGNCCPTGLSSRIESPYHDELHVIMGNNHTAAMSNFRSPAAPIFWLWHAYVDDIWKKWECNCPQSNTAQVDLYMKDTPMIQESERDRGEEPNIDNGPMWVSEDLWVRNQPDGLMNQEHQNPEYMAQAGNYNYVYIRVRNRGCVNSEAGAQLKLYWAKASTTLSWPASYNGTQLLPALMGAPVGAIIIPSIKAGGSTVVEIPWQPENPATYAAVGNDPVFWANEPWHFCLLARIEAGNDPMTFPETADVYANAKKNNNIIMKNISVVDVDPNNLTGGGGWTNDKVIGASVFVGDPWGAGGVYDLTLQNPHSYRGNPVTAEAEVRITLDVPLWQAWVQGGGHLENMRVSNEARHQLIVIGDPARIKDIPLHANERSLCHVSFNFLARELSGQTAFDYDVLQTATDGRTIGGERYHLTLPGRPGFYADAGANKNTSPNNSVDLNAYSLSEPAIYNWYDPEGNLLETGTSLTVSPAISTKYKLEVIAEGDGVKDYDEVEVKIKEHEITGVSPNPTTGTTVVDYRLTNATSAYIMLSRPYSNVNNQYILDVSNTQIQLNVDQLLPGTYSLVLMVNGQQTDVGTVTIL